MILPQVFIILRNLLILFTLLYFTLFTLLYFTLLYFTLLYFTLFHLLIHHRVQKGLKSTAYRDREGRYAPALEGGTYGTALHSDVLTVHAVSLGNAV